MGRIFAGHSPVRTFWASVKLFGGRGGESLIFDFFLFQLGQRSNLARWCQRPEQDGRCTIVRTQQLSGDPTALADFLEELDLIDPAVDGVHSFDDDELLKTLRKEVCFRQLNILNCCSATHTSFTCL